MEKTKILSGVVGSVAAHSKCARYSISLSISRVGTHLHLCLNILLWLNQCELTHPQLFSAVCIFLHRIHKWIHFICVLFVFVYARQFHIMSPKQQPRNKHKWKRNKENIYIYKCAELSKLPIEFHVKFERAFYFAVLSFPPSLRTLLNIQIVAFFFIFFPSLFFLLFHCVRYRKQSFLCWHALYADCRGSG